MSFPFSDLSQALLRPALVLADADHDDYILCQITSNPYADVRAVEITNANLVEGTLHQTSYIRPGKIFTAHNSVIRRQIATLEEETCQRVVEAIVALIRRADDMPAPT